MTNRDIGQLDMYVRMFEDLRKAPGDNPTIGIILCSDKDATLVKYSVLNESAQLFASAYKLILPTESQLREVVEQQKEVFQRLPDQESA